jgi:hypothetical protein
MAITRVEARSIPARRSTSSLVASPSTYRPLWASSRSSSWSIATTAWPTDCTNEVIDRPTRPIPQTIRCPDSSSMARCMRYLRNWPVIRPSTMLSITMVAP